MQETQVADEAQWDCGFEHEVHPDGTIRITTAWIAVAHGNGEERQCRITTANEGIDCEIRSRKPGCRASAWEWIGHNPRGLGRSIRLAAELRQLSDSFLGLYRRAEQLGGER